MPTMAAMTVKKNDGTTDVVYSVLQASGGDKSPAIWRSDSATGYPGQKPTLAIKASGNTDGSIRRVEGTFVFPSVYTDTATSTTKVLGKAYFNFNTSIPASLPTADAEEFGAQIGNLIAHALVEEIVTVGYSAS